MIRPTIQQLVERCTNDIIGRLSDEELPLASDARVYGIVMGGVFNAMYGYADWIHKQQYAHSADEEYLIAHGNFWLGENPMPATKAAGLVSFTGSGVIPQGAIVRSADGVEYSVDNEVTAPITTSCTALIAGVESNKGSVSLTLTSAIAGVDNAASSTGFSGGADEETVEEYRTRILEKQSARPLYGKKGDYKIWAMEAGGITRVWEKQATTPLNRVLVYVVDDGSNPITPSSLKISEVQSHIDELMPIGADVHVLAPILQPVNFTIANPDSITVKEAIAQSLADLFIRESEVGGTLLISHIREAISTATGETDHNLISPAANIIAGAGVLKTMGFITWA